MKRSVPSPCNGGHGGVDDVDDQPRADAVDTSREAKQTRVASPCRHVGAPKTPPELGVGIGIGTSNFLVLSAMDVMDRMAEYGLGEEAFEEPPRWWLNQMCSVLSHDPSTNSSASFGNQEVQVALCPSKVGPFGPFGKCQPRTPPHEFGLFDIHGKRVPQTPPWSPPPSPGTPPGPPPPTPSVLDESDDDARLPPIGSQPPPHPTTLPPSRDRFIRPGPLHVPWSVKRRWLREAAEAIRLEGNTMPEQ